MRINTKSITIVVALSFAHLSRSLKCEHKSGLDLRRNLQSCKVLGNSCDETCECCGYENQNVRCEKRNNPLGYRCYKSMALGQECDFDHDCITQKCVNGRCANYHTHGPKVPTCSLTKNVTSVLPIKGTIKKNTCRCDKPSEPTKDDAENAIDGDEDTIYINNWATNGGIEVTPGYKGGLHSIKICNSDDCPECDPTCYKLEGYCEFKDGYETIQEGTLHFPGRNTCVTIRVGGKPIYTSYRLTFPCQRGTCGDSCERDCYAAPFPNPALGPCSDYVDDGINNVGSMKLIDREYEQLTDRTVFYYSVDNINLNYLGLGWQGDCMVDYYYVYEDVNGDELLQDDEVCCFKKCGNDFVSIPGTEIPFLCMNGLMITTHQMNWPPGKYIIKLVMRGNIGQAMLPYGAVGKDAVSGEVLTEFGQVLSPKCPSILCEATCPLKLSEISFNTQDCGP